MHVAAIRPQVENRIADDLAGTVVGHVAAAAGFEHARLPSAASVARLSGDVRAPAVALDAKRDDGRMLEQEQQIGNAIGAPLLDERRAAARAPPRRRTRSEAADFKSRHGQAPDEPSLRPALSSKSSSCFFTSAMN